MALHNRRPRVESLEGRLALSAGGTAALVKPHPVALNGTVSGGFGFAASNPDADLSSTLTSSGRVSPLGRVSGSGTITSPGINALGPASGTFTLANAHGSVTIRLTGPIQAGSALSPRYLTFKIIAATGRDVGDVDQGKATLFVTIADPLPSPPASGTAIIIGPIFNLTLHSTHR